jgi:putative restriction endonuclease
VLNPATSELARIGHRPRIYPQSVIGTADAQIRGRVFGWLTEQREERGETLPRTLLENFTLGGRRIPLLGPQGIWKPAACELPLSITTVYGSRYDDGYDAAQATLQYAYRGTDPNHRDNAGLRRAMVERVPVVYFFAIEPSLYAAAYPAFVRFDDPAHLRFTVQVDALDAAFPLTGPDDYPFADDHADARRAYVTRTVRQRLHQVAFRERVIRAYQERCALCRLGHGELLDAAHITPDREADSEPIVSNGVALCKLHHAAFDRFFFAIRPDYVVEVRPSILTESDGPMLVVGLQQIHGSRIALPRRLVHLPDRDRLARRYAEFLRAS